MSLEVKLLQSVLESQGVSNLRECVAMAKRSTDKLGTTEHSMLVNSCTRILHNILLTVIEKTCQGPHDTPLSWNESIVGPTWQDNSIDNAAVPAQHACIASVDQCASLNSSITEQCLAVVGLDSTQVKNSSSNLNSSAATFTINRNKLNHMPARVVLYFSISSFIALSGMAGPHFAAGGWESVVCNSDGTLRINLPDGNSDSMWCVVCAALQNFFFQASLMWWICLTHAWCITFRALKSGVKLNVLTGKVGLCEKLYHALTWSMISAMTIGLLVQGKVGGLPVVDSCFTVDWEIWMIYITIPSVVFGAVGMLFLAIGSHYVAQTRGQAKTMVKYRQGKSGRINLADLLRFQAKVGILMIVTCFHTIGQAGLGVYLLRAAPRWKKMTDLHVTCTLLACKEQWHLCPPLPSISTALYCLVFVLFFSQYIAMASWVTTMDNLNTWKVFLHSPLKTLQHGVPTSRQSVTSIKTPTIISMRSTRHSTISSSSRISNPDSIHLRSRGSTGDSLSQGCFSFPTRRNSMPQPWDTQKSDPHNDLVACRLGCSTDTLQTTLSQSMSCSPMSSESRHMAAHMDPMLTPRQGIDGGIEKVIEDEGTVSLSVQLPVPPPVSSDFTPPSDCGHSEHHSQ